MPLHWFQSNVWSLFITILSLVQKQQNFDLRSYNTLHRWHQLSIKQTKIIYYNFPDTTANFEKKLLQKQWNNFSVNIRLTFWSVT